MTAVIRVSARPAFIKVCINVLKSKPVQANLPRVLTDPLEVLPENPTSIPERTDPGIRRTPGSIPGSFYFPSRPEPSDAA